MVSNVSGQADTFTISAISDDASILPAIVSSTLDIAAGAWVQVPLQWSATGLSAGPHQGFISITSSSGTSIRVPFWYAVASTPAKVTVLDTYTSARRGSFLSDAILFRITDPSGVALTGVQPEVTVTAGGGAVNQVVSYDSDIPGMFGIDVVLGFVPGSNTFHIKAGDAILDVTIPVDNPSSRTTAAVWRTGTSQPRVLLPLFLRWGRGFGFGHCLGGRRRAIDPPALLVALDDFLEQAHPAQAVRKSRIFDRAAGIGDTRPEAAENILCVSSYPSLCPPGKSAYAAAAG